MGEPTTLVIPPQAVSAPVPRANGNPLPALRRRRAGTLVPTVRPVFGGFRVSSSSRDVSYLVTQPNGHLKCTCSPSRRGGRIQVQTRVGGRTGPRRRSGAGLRHGIDSAARSRLCFLLRSSSCSFCRRIRATQSHKEHKGLFVGSFRGGERSGDGLVGGQGSGAESE